MVMSNIYERLHDLLSYSGFTDTKLAEAHRVAIVIMRACEADDVCDYDVPALLSTLSEAVAEHNDAVSSGLITEPRYMCNCSTHKPELVKRNVGFYIL